VRNDAGFSLTELMIVILCAGLVAAAAVPNIAHMQKAWTLWGGTRTLEASLQWGRMHAISANTPVLFEVDGSRRKFYWVDPVSGDPYSESVRQLPDGLLIVACPSRPLRFYQHGNAAPAGTFRIDGQAGSYSVIVAPGGRIRIQKN
jgi:prepilin-type N-terminal cleavage/methylation domain-containing protein